MDVKGSMVMDSEQADSFRELGNIGASYAATTLSNMLSTTVGIKAPELFFVRMADLHSHVDSEVAAHVIFQVQGELKTTGYIILHIPRQSAIRLVNIMAGNDDFSPDRELTDIDSSAIDEIGTVMISAFLDACEKLFGLVLPPSPSTCIIDIPHAVLDSIMVTLPGIEEIDEVVLLRTELICSSRHINTTLMLLPSKSMLDAILGYLRLVLDDMLLG